MAKTELFARHKPGGVFTILNEMTYGGERFWVDYTNGTDGASRGKNPDTPLKTLDYAIGLCTANADDVIILKSGHAENIVAAGSVTVDVAGVTIIGQGAGNKRPTFTFTTETTATFIISAANVTIKNLRFICDKDALAVGLPITGAYCTIEDCEFSDLGEDNCIDWITLSAAADNARIINCRNYGTATAGNDSFISMAAASNVEIIGLVSQGDFAAANIECTAAPVDLLVADCYLENANAVDVNIEGFAAATGWIARNCCRVATDGEVTWVNTGGAMSLFENYGVNDDGETGMIVGTASTT